MEAVNFEQSDMAVMSVASKQPESSSKSFIEANTVSCSLEEIKDQHIIPVFVKDNEPVVSHHDFIRSAWEVVKEYFDGEQIYSPTIRLSHPIKGRIPEAKNKPAFELLEHEKTLYYERMAFIIEIPSIREQIDKNFLSLCVGGVKSYHLDNLNGRKGTDEHFKIFIGYQNKVCTNLCVWSDGYVGDVRVSNQAQLVGAMRTMVENYNASFQISEMRQLCQHSITEKQFAHLIGRTRLYQFLPPEAKKHIPHLLLGDNQIGTICRDYYRDASFCKDERGDINLWKLYNLFTGANKSSYIDSFLERGIDAYRFVEQLRLAIEGQTSNWYLD